MKITAPIFATLLLSGIAASTSTAQAAQYEIRIENMTEGQPFSPGVIVTHTSDVSLFKMKGASSDALKAIAEDGKPKMAMDMLKGMMGKGVTDVVTTEKPIMRIGTDMPTSATFTINANDGDMLSFATMLICTNDGFTGADSVKLTGKMMMMETMAYDAGSEVNNELTNSLVDPCGKAGPVMSEADGNINDIPEDGGVVAPHNNIQGVGHLTDAHIWSGPVAKVTIKPKN